VTQKLFGVDSMADSACDVIANAMKLAVVWMRCLASNYRHIDVVAEELVLARWLPGPEATEPADTMLSMNTSARAMLKQTRRTQQRGSRRCPLSIEVIEGLRDGSPLPSPARFLPPPPSRVPPGSPWLPPLLARCPTFPATGLGLAAQLPPQARTPL
jgi:hypothetical protein